MFAYRHKFVAKDAFGRLGVDRLTAAAKAGDLETVGSLLAKGIAPDQQDSSGSIALLKACIYGHVEIVRLLLDKGANINIQNHLGKTPLLYAAQFGYAEVADLLIDRGAEISLKNMAGDTALTVAEKAGYAEIAQMLKEGQQKRIHHLHARLMQILTGSVQKQIDFLLIASDPLMKIIHAGDIGKARAFFDELFWENKNCPPQWEHLQVALLQENKPMLRFLVNKGAACTQKDLAKFKKINAEKYPHYAALLRQCGLRLPGSSPSIHFGRG
jgi:ankyrin repeat protein